MRFLVVDDDRACRALLENILGRYGECDAACDGDEAIQRVREALDARRPYDLVCLDIMMPNRDGHQTLDAIRQIEYEHGVFGSDGVKVVMVTALSDSKHCIRAFHEGCESYVTKPIDAMVLLDQVRVLLGRLETVPPTSVRPATPTRRPSHGRPRYLIVDDDRICRELLRSYLEPLGECDFAYDADEAIDAVRLALADGRPYDLVCLDIMMPGKSGHDALTEIRMLESDHGVLGSDGVPVIMTTALKDSKHCIRAFAEGCESYVTKPINQDDLLSAMRDLGVPCANPAAT
ncbi:MAG: response regulator [Pirellulales bacterium]|nr:response regulator [Pirellulales bacterium]